jgi:NAD-dependent dihydropyrimidine dehydrogenase PreA subunit
MKRKIIKIDEDTCNGCGLCIPNCQEGALQIIDGKARLVSDLFCDGLGACMGECPEGALEVVEREAEPYDELRVMEVLATQGQNTILAHLEHLRDHGEEEYLQQAIEYLKTNHLDMTTGNKTNGFGCPGSRALDFREPEPAPPARHDGPAVDTASELRQWPVQMHLLNPGAPYFRNADVVLTADCVPFALADYHTRYLRGHSVAVACPKLDSNQESYLEKLTSMISDARINSLHVLMMEVPCCGGLLQMARMARQKAGRNIPVKQTIISLRGEVLAEDWA